MIGPPRVIFDGALQPEYALATGFQPYSVLLGDVNGDGHVNGLDVNPFVAAVISGNYSHNADVNGDSFVNGLDVAPFIATVISQ